MITFFIGDRALVSHVGPIIATGDYTVLQLTGPFLAATE
jgi:hypothetical protein